MSFEREDGTKGMSDKAYTNGDIIPIDYVKPSFLWWLLN